jgi:hypothetical protein
MKAILFAILAAAALAQDPELGRIETGKYDAKLIIDFPRPVDSAVKTLVSKYRIPVNVEDPLYLFAGDTERIPRVRFPVPRREHLEVTYPVKPDGTPKDVRAMLQALVDAANRELPFAFILDDSGGQYTLIPTKTRDARGRVIDMRPLLDREVTIPPGKRRIYEHAMLMSESLSKQTGFQVSCCQAGGIAGIPWGMEQIQFAADNETARRVLRRLIALTGGRQYYFQRCDPVEPGRPTFCFINVAPLPSVTSDWQLHPQR